MSILCAPLVFAVTVWCVHQIEDLYYEMRFRQIRDRLFWDSVCG